MRGKQNNNNDNNNDNNDNNNDNNNNYYNYNIIIIIMVYSKYSLVNSVTNGPTNLAVLAGDRINEGFFYKKMYGRFAGRPKKVAVIMRWP